MTIDDDEGDGGYRGGFYLCRICHKDYLINNGNGCIHCDVMYAIYVGKNLSADADADEGDADAEKTKTYRRVWCNQRLAWNYGQWDAQGEAIEAQRESVDYLRRYYYNK